MRALPDVMALVRGQVYGQEQRPRTPRGRGLFIYSTFVLSKMTLEVLLAG